MFPLFRAIVKFCSTNRLFKYCIISQSISFIFVELEVYYRYQRRKKALDNSRSMAQFIGLSSTRILINRFLIKKRVCCSKCWLAILKHAWGAHRNFSRWPGGVARPPDGDGHWALASHLWIFQTIELYKQRVHKQRGQVIKPPTSGSSQRRSRERRRNRSFSAANMANYLLSLLVVSSVAVHLSVGINVTINGVGKVQGEVTVFVCVSKRCSDHDSSLWLTIWTVFYVAT